MRLYPDATKRFLEDPTSGLNTKASRDTYKTTLKALQICNTEKHLTDFTEDDLVAFCGKAGLSPATVASYRTRVTGFFSWAEWRGHIEHDPSRNLKKLVKGSFSKPVKEHHWLNVDEVSRVFDTIDTSTPVGMRAMVVARLGFTCGLRRNEILGLTWKQVDLDKQQITLKGKGDKLAAVYITDMTLPWLDKWHSQATTELGRVPHDEPVVPQFNTLTDFATGWQCKVEWQKPVSTDVIGKTVRRVADGAGVRFSPHDMRRSFANMLEEKGASIEEISAALRHADIGVTQKYLERRQDAAYKAVRGRGFDV